MAALERSDIISDDALKAPEILTAELQVLLAAIDQIKVSTKAFGDSLSAAPLPKLKTDVDGLTAAQVEYNKIVTQINTVTAKNNDLNIAMAQQLKNAKDELNNAKATADSFTKSVTAQNSSIVQLTDALNKNRVAYSNLRSESDRQSKSGQDLLKTIQSQDTSLKSLSASMGQNQSKVGAYREEIEKLLPAMRAVNPIAAEATEAVSSFGTKLLTIVASPVTLGIAALVGGILFLKTAVDTFFARTMEGEDAAAKSAGDWSALLEVVNDKFAEIGTSISKTLGLQDHAIAGIIYMTLKQFSLNDAAAEYAAKTAEISNLTDKQILQRKEELTLVIDIATADAQKSKDMFESRQKMERSDAERIELGKDALKQLNTEADLRLKKNTLEQEIAKQEIATGADTYAAEQKLANLKADAIRMDAERYQGARRIQSQIIADSRDIVTKRIENEKEVTDATLMNATTIVNAEVEKNQRVLKSDQSTLDEKLQAQKNYVNDLTLLINIAAQKEIEAAKNQRDTQLNTVGTNDTAQRLAIEQAFVNKETAILAKAQEDQTKVIIDGYDKDIQIITAHWAKRQQLDATQATKDMDIQLTALEESFSKQEIGLVAYNNRKAQIQRDGLKESDEMVVADYDMQIKSLQEYISENTYIDSTAKAALLKALADYQKAREKLLADGNAQEIKYEKQRNAELVQLGNTLVISARTIGDNLLQDQADRIATSIQQLQDQETTEITLAGDNANAKAAITKKYNALIASENEKAAKLKHDQAVFDRDMAIFQAEIKTAEAIMQIWGDIEMEYYEKVILTAIMAGIGIVETAAIASKPIPSYEVGTSYHPGGPARVAEHGGELVMEPGRAPRLYDVPNTIIPNLAIGSKVYTAEETNAINRQFTNQSFDNAPTVVINDNDEVVDALYKTRAPGLHAQGRELMEVWEARNGSKKWIRSKMFINP